MNVLIAGGAGYLGGALAPQLLAAGHRVTALDRLSFGPAAVDPLRGHDRFRLLTADLRDYAAVIEAVRGQDAVILLAALVGEAACDRDPAETVAVNYLASLNLMRAAAYYGVKRFIFTSTDSCYGAQENVFLTEEAPLKPISLYAELKAQVEAEFLAMPRPDNFHPTILRLATLFGLAPRMRFDLVINILTREAVTGRGAKIFSGEQWRPLVHVRDAAKAFVAALAAPADVVSGQIFNVGSNRQNVQFKDLAGILRQAMPEAKVETVPQPPDLRDYHVCFDKISAALNFNPDFEPVDGICEIRDAILSGALGDPYDVKYRNA
ncbi:MAG: SDR family oxidoreductase [Candidatus Adiutrix sp.]|jgi:nucleoside-diphosphate-sugar epimerase|nr:SDR family oxidoreductase [Candidatus Adiutrix sp.]